MKYVFTLYTTVCCPQGYTCQSCDIPLQYIVGYYGIAGSMTPWIHHVLFQSIFAAIF